MSINKCKDFQALRGEKPMINPYAVPSAPIVADDGGWDSLAPSQIEMESDRIEQQQQAQVVYKPQWPPRGTPYAIEKGTVTINSVVNFQRFLRFCFYF
jgi:hypothetical protein